MLSVYGNSQIVVKETLSIRQTYYKIDAMLVTVRRVVKGEMETLYRQYMDKGFVVLGFPCNQFGNQEPGNEKEIY
jgi:hypothetical protein